MIGFFNKTLRNNFRTKPRTSIKEKHRPSVSVKKIQIVKSEELKTPERRVNRFKPSISLTPKSFNKNDVSQKDENDDWHHI